MPSWAEVGKRLNALATSEGEWSGIPTLLPGLTLSLVDDHPWADRLAGAQTIVDENEPKETVTCTEDDLKWQVVNAWYSRKEQRTILIITDGEKFEIMRSSKHDHVRRLDLAFNTFKAHEAWLVETEMIAQQKLMTLIKPHLFNAYFLTGMFVETSKRSRLTYVFRRLRPTIVISWKGGKGEPICTLCLHPIGYYDDSFAGSMCPTDEVIAHLMLMRGDEHLYWKRANQHEPWRPESGL
jgi:hypothetical protein